MRSTYTRWSRARQSKNGNADKLRGNIHILSPIMNTACLEAGAMVRAVNRHSLPATSKKKNIKKKMACAPVMCVPSFPPSGLVLTPNTMASVGGATPGVGRGSSRPSSAHAIVSPTQQLRQKNEILSRAAASREQRERGGEEEAGQDKKSGDQCRGGGEEPNRSENRTEQNRTARAIDREGVQYHHCSLLISGERREGGRERRSGCEVRKYRGETKADRRKKTNSWRERTGNTTRKGQATESRVQPAYTSQTQPPSPSTNNNRK